MKCRPGCAGCCIYISISSPIPGLPRGKKAGEPCIHLNAHKHCVLHGTEDYPDVCKSFTPDIEYCGTSNNMAKKILTDLESLTC